MFYLVTILRICQGFTPKIPRFQVEFLATELSCIKTSEFQNKIILVIELRPVFVL